MPCTRGRDCSPRWKRPPCRCADAGAQTLEFLKKHIAEPATVPLAGNSIGTDRRFLAAQLPEMEDFLHYRSVDVSTIKELCRRWFPDIYKGAPAKKGGHRALQDIRESVAELAYYRAAVFHPAPADQGGAGMSRTKNDVPSVSIDEANASLTAPGQMFEMEEVEIRGVLTRTWKNATGDPRRRPRSCRSAHGEATFLVYEDERTTFVEHFHIACTLAQRLQSTFGIEPGDRVAIVMRNLPEWVMSFWAATIAGAVVVPLNAWWSGEELRYGLEDSGSKVAFVDTERAERIRPFLGGLDGLHHADRGRRAPRRAQGPLAVHEPRRSGPGGRVAVRRWRWARSTWPPRRRTLTIDPEDDATIFYTSGTTGRPKGAVGTHRNICTNLMNLFFLNTRGALRFGTSSSPPMADREKVQPAYLLSVPLFHATGCHAVMVGNIAAGGKIVMMHHFDPERALELIEREGIAHLRRRARHGHAGAGLAELRQVRHLLHPRCELRRRTGATRSGAAHPGGLARRPTLERVRPDRDVVGHLHELGRRLHRQA